MSPIRLILFVGLASWLSLHAAEGARVVAPVDKFEAVLRKALQAPLVRIVDKQKPSPTGDARDYVSYARYWWPDPAKPDGLPFVRRDGQHNRAQVEAGDRGKIDDLGDAVETLSQGWVRLRREDCARRAGEWLRAWFVTPETRMTPALDHAQMRLGHNGNRGSPGGIIDTRRFAGLVRAIALLENSPALTAEENAAVRRWFTDYFHWLDTSSLAAAERRARNNHGSWFLVQAVAIARFLGRDDAARRLGGEGRARIGWQFAPDGSQPEELRRADSLSYSTFNLEALLALAALIRPFGIDLWNYTAPNGASLRRGLDHLRPYNADPARWPHPQNDRLDPGFLDELLAQVAALDAER